MSKLDVAGNSKCRTEKRAAVLKAFAASKNARLGLEDVKKACGGVGYFRKVANDLVKLGKIRYFRDSKSYAVAGGR